MKKLTLTIGCALAVAGAAFAQGTVQWIPASSALVAQTNATAYSPFVVGGGVASGLLGVGNVGIQSTVGTYYYMLLTQAGASQIAAPTTYAQLAAWSGAWADPTVNAANSTTLANGRPVMNPLNDTGQTVTWGNGTSQSILLVGWSGNLGTSWSTVLNELNNWSTVMSTITGPSFVGVSSTGFVNPGTANPGAVIFGTTAGLIYNPTASAMNLYILPVPEPSTLAVAGLGGLSLLLFRRQRK